MTATEREAVTREEPAPAGQPTITARIRQILETVGPTTLATALLVYFGYVATRARFEYFGVSLEMAGLSNQSLLLYGLEVVFVPAALLFLGVLAVVGVHTAVRWQLARHPGDTANTLMAAGIVLAGMIMVGRALIGMFFSDPRTSVEVGTTPLALALGPGAVVYGVWAYERNRGRAVVPRRQARSAVACAIGLAVAGLFWSSTQLAVAYGTGRGVQDAEELANRPSVIVDTKEPLLGLPPGVIPDQLSDDPAKDAADGHFAYRYRDFRLLLISDGRLFLVTATRTTGQERTIVLPYDNDIRIQLIPPP